MLNSRFAAQREVDACGHLCSWDDKSVARQSNDLAEAL
jgi:hypothetical protein